MKMTPPMGWNSWNTFGRDINEQLILDMARKISETGLQSVGYNYIVIDDCWSLKQRDKNGRLQPDPEKYDEALLQRLKVQRIDLIVLAGFLGIVGEKVLARYSGRILNIHPALIPSFCGKGFYGLHVHEAVLARGCKVTGAILLQKAVDVLPGDTPETLQRRVMEQAEWHLLPAATKMLAEEMEEAK